MEEVGEKVCAEMSDLFRQIVLFLSIIPCAAFGVIKACRNLLSFDSGSGFQTRPTQKA